MSLSRYPLLFALIPAWMAALPTAAFSAESGGTSSGGADVVVHPEGTVALADPYATDLATYIIEHNLKPLTFDGLGPELAAEMEKASLILSGMTASEQKVLGLARNAFVEAEIKSPDNKYYFVDRIPELPECLEDQLTYNNLPQGSRVEQGFCTSGRNTLLVQSYFDALSPRGKSLTFVHEGLRRLPHFNPRAIAHVSNGLAVALELLDRQVAGNRDPLNEKQLRQLTLLHSAALTIDAESAKSSAATSKLRFITPNGGGLVSKSAKSVDPSAFIGVGTFIGSGWTVGANAVIVNSRLMAPRPLMIGKDVKVISSSFTIGCTIKGWHSADAVCVPTLGEGFESTDSTVRNIIAMDEGIRIRNSRLNGYWLELARGATVENVEIAKHYPLELYEGASLKNLKAPSLDTQITFRSGLRTMFSLTTGYAGYRIPSRTEVDAGNQILCPSGENRFLTSAFFYWLNSVDDLKAACLRN